MNRERAWARCWVDRAYALALPTKTCKAPSLRCLVAVRVMWHGRPAAKGRPPFTAAHGHLELQGRRLDTAGAVHGGYRVYYLLRGRTWHSGGCAACGICCASGAFGVDGRPRSCIAGLEPCGVRSVFAKQKTLHPIIWQPTRKEQNAVWNTCNNYEGLFFSGEVIFFLRRMFVSLILGIEPFAMPYI